MRANTTQFSPNERKGANVIGTFVDALDSKKITRQVIEWGEQNQSRTVCLCNVHSSVTARKNRALSAALKHSDIVLPDGAPIAWTLRRKGHKGVRRIAGPDLMLDLCREASEKEVGIFLFGSDPTTITLLENKLRHAFPQLLIKGSLSPCFGTWSPEQEQTYIDAINYSGAGLIFVGLGCPKQEIWMAKRTKEIHGVLLGVGAAFDFHAGTIKRAPQFMQRLGVEWLHRLCSEPRRLLRRYLVTNSLFIYLTAHELWKQRGGPR